MEVKVCVECFSQNTSIDSPRAIFGVYADTCNECGFTGTMMLMEKTDADKLRSENHPTPKGIESMSGSEPNELTPKGTESISRPEPDALPSYYCTECMRNVEGKRTLFGSLKCEYCKSKLKV